MLVNCLIFLVIYVISIIGNYRFYRSLYHDTRSYFYLGQGKFSHEAKIRHVVVVFVPYINTVNMLFCYNVIGWRDEKYKRKINFFKPRKT